MRKDSLFAVVALIVAISAPQAAHAEDLLTGFLGTGLVGMNDGTCKGSRFGRLRDLGWEGGVDVLIFDVYANHGVDGAGGSDFFEKFDTSVDGRFWFGARRDDGIGMHMRFFEFEGDPTDPDEFVDVTMIDLEGSGVLEICDWQFTGITGFRYGRIDWSDENGDEGFGFEGVGMTLGGEVRRSLRPNLAVVARCRYSALYGDIKEENDPADDFNEGTAVHGLETSVGMEWSRCTRYGLLTVGGGWEQQLYSSLSGNVDSDIDPEDVDITLAGPAITVSIRR